MHAQGAQALRGALAALEGAGLLPVLLPIQRDALKTHLDRMRRRHLKTSKQVLMSYHFKRNKLKTYLDLGSTQHLKT